MQAVDAYSFLVPLTLHLVVIRCMWRIVNMSRNAGHHVFNFLQFTLLEHVVLEYTVAADLKQVPCSF